MHSTRGMSLIGVVLTLVVIGVILWLVLTYIPMPPVFQRLITGVVVIVVVLWLLQVFGVLGRVSAVRVG